MLLNLGEKRDGMGKKYFQRIYFEIFSANILKWELFISLLDFLFIIDVQVSIQKYV